MLHISICDDDAIVIEKLKKLIKFHMEQLGVNIVIQTYSDGEEFLNQYRIRDDELIFLDIDMPKKTGIDVMRELEFMERNRNIVLISSYDHLVLDSLSYAPFQIIRKINMQKDIPDVLLRYLKQKSKAQNYIEIKGKGKIHHIPKANIIYMEKYKHHIIVHLQGNDEIKTRGKLSEFEVTLSGDRFLRIHSGYLVNLRFCCSIEKRDMLLKSGEKIPISRERKKLVTEQFMISRR